MDQTIRAIVGYAEILIKKIRYNMSSISLAGRYSGRP